MFIAEYYQIPLDTNIAAIVNPATNKIFGEYKMFNYNSTELPTHHIECVNPLTDRVGGGVILKVNNNDFIAVTASHLFFSEYIFSVFYYFFNHIFLSNFASLECHVAAHIALHNIQCKALQYDYYYDQAFISCNYGKEDISDKLKSVNVMFDDPLITKQTITYFKEYRYDAMFLGNIPRYYDDDNLFKHYYFALKGIEETEINFINDDVSRVFVKPRCIMAIYGNIDYEKNGFYYHRLMQNAGYSGSGVTVKDDDMKDVLIGTVEGWSNRLLFYGEGKNRISSINHSFFKRNYEKYVKKAKGSYTSNHKNDL